MPDVPLKITDYVIFVLNQIASSAGFLGRQVLSSAKGLETHMGDRRGAGTENIPYTQVPGPRALGQGHHCELLWGRLHPPTRKDLLRGQEAGRGPSLQGPGRAVLGWRTESSSCGSAEEAAETAVGGGVHGVVGGARLPGEPGGWS